PDLRRSGTYREPRHLHGIAALRDRSVHRSTPGPGWATPRPQNENPEAAQSARRYDSKVRDRHRGAALPEAPRATKTPKRVRAPRPRRSDRGYVKRTRRTPPTWILRARAIGSNRSPPKQNTARRDNRPPESAESEYAWHRERHSPQAPSV